MKVYIYPLANRPVSSRWHGKGGVVIVTDRDPQVVWEEWAKENGLPVSEGDKPLAVEVPGIYVPAPEPGDPRKHRYVPGEPGDPISYELVGEHEEKVIVFPDAGCC